MIVGATGATGKHLLRELLASNKFTRVGEFGRRLTPVDDLPGKEKLQQTVIDFEKLDEEKLKAGKWDVVFITCVHQDCARCTRFFAWWRLSSGIVRRLGTSRRVAGSAEAFEKIDRQ